MGLFEKTNEEIKVRLVCDPAEGNEKTLFGIAPISSFDFEDARAEAGPYPRVGERARSKKAAAELVALTAALKRLRPDTDLDADSIQGVLDTLTVVEATEIATSITAATNEVMNTDEVYTSIHAVETWEIQFKLNVIKLAVRSVDGDTSSDVVQLLHKIRPQSLTNEVIAELHSRIVEVSELTDAGKSEYAARYGLPPTVTEGDGPVENAKTN